MAENSDDVKMALDASDGQLKRMSKELEDAPTYAVTVDTSKKRMVISSSKSGFDEPGDLSTRTCIVSPSLYQKFTDLGKDMPKGLKGRYEPLEILGEGGAGVVYGMMDHNMEREVAVKLLKDGRSANDRQSFIHEGAVSAKLEHPNIIPVYDLDADDSGQVYLTMKKVTGHNLKSYIDGKVELDFEEIILIFLKVCDALEYAHSKGKIHQDVKPENVMFGEFGEVFVIDWGAASLSGDDLQLSPVYMSPQQAKGRISELSDDIYCLGASLFHVLTKRFPTGAETITELWDKKEKGIVDPPTTREKHRIPKPLLAIAMKAMRPNPEDRYQSVLEFAEDLKAYQTGFATTAEEAGLFYHFGLLAKRRMKESIIAFAAICIIGSMGMIYFASIKRAQVAEAEAETARVAAELKAIKLAEELEDSWLPLVSWDFTKPKTLPTLPWFNAYNRAKDGFRLHFDSSLTGVVVYEGFLVEPKLEIMFSSPRVPSLQLRFAYPDIGVSRGFIIGDKVGMDAYDPHYSSPYQSPINLSEVLFFDKPNRVTCWLENSTWHIELNGKTITKYYDKNLGAVNLRGTIRIARHVPFCPLTIHSVKLSQRRPPSYVSILEPGRVLRSAGDMVNARNWFLAQASLLKAPRQVQEARYLAALTDGGQGIDVQLKELADIYDDESSPFRFSALHHRTVLYADSGDWKTLLELTEESTRKAPELNTYRVVAGKLKHAIRSLPYEERIDALCRIIKLPVSALDLTHLSLNDLSFLRGQLNPTIKKISLADNPITDLSPLKGVKAKIVEIYETEIADLSPIVNPDLKSINASSTKVTDFSPLAGLSMDQIIAKRCPPIDAQSFKGTTVARLILDHSKIINPAGLGWTDAKSIRLNHCGLKNTAFMEKLDPAILRMEGNDITELSGFEDKTMGILSLAKNHISDLSPLSNCKITQGLNISKNPVAELSPLNNQLLQALDVSETKVADLSVLKTMPNLTSFRYVNTYDDEPVTVDMSTLGTVSIQKLTLSGLRLTKIDPLKNCVITNSLDLSNNPITDASALGLQPLVSLNLMGTRLRSLAGLEGLRSLENLSLGYDADADNQQLWDLNPLRDAPLKSLRLANCDILDVSPINSFSGLTSLAFDDVSANYNDIELSKLTHLRVFNSTIKKLGFVKGLKNLLVLHLDGCDLGDEPSQALKTLVGFQVAHLALVNCGITDLTPIQLCSVEQSLNLSKNPITDLSPLQGMSIGKLDLSGTKVEDFSPLRRVKGLKRLDVKEMKITPEQMRVLDSLSLETLVFE